MDTSDQLHAYSQQLAAEIRRRRKARGWTQKELAERAGLKHSTWRVVESGHNNVTNEHLIAIAGALGVSVRDLWPGGPVRASATLPVDEEGIAMAEPDGPIRHVEVTQDAPEMGFQAGDTLTLDPDAPMRLGKTVLIDVHGTTRLCRVISEDPTILFRAGDAPVVYDERYHRLIGVCTELRRLI